MQIFTKWHGGKATLNKSSSIAPLTGAPANAPGAGAVTYPRLTPKTMMGSDVFTPPPLEAATVAPWPHKLNASVASQPEARAAPVTEFPPAPTRCPLPGTNSSGRATAFFNY